MRSITAILALIAVPSALGELRLGSVTQGSGGKWVFEAKYDANAVAFGNYTTSDSMPSGFGDLKITTNSKFSAWEQFGAAGYLEGMLSYDAGANHASNWVNWFRDQFHNGSIPSVFPQWFTEQEAWAREMVATQNKTDEIWEAVGLVYAQMDGMEAAYGEMSSAGKVPALSHFEFYGPLQSMGDILTLLPAFSEEHRCQEEWPRERKIEWLRKNSHCSAFVKALGDLSDIFSAQVAWFTYASMTRAAKIYDFGTSHPGRTSLYSSYPLLLSSLDDFYTMPSSNMVMLQTTNGIMNNALYKKITTHTLLSWQRVRASNLLATGGEHWAQICADDEATYSNQYMVIDYKKFTPGKALQPGTLWVTEQIPGLYVAADMTQTLERGYWGSYNVPFFRAIYDTSGYPQLDDEDELQGVVTGANVTGPQYQLAPRGQIFRRDQGKVDTFEQFGTFMRTNNYKTDPIAKGDPWSAICSRGDLASSPSADGCYDGKWVNMELLEKGQAYFVNGPTTSSHTLPPFSWTSTFNSTPHQGMPHTFDHTPTLQGMGL